MPIRKKCFVKEEYQCLIKIEVLCQRKWLGYGKVGAVFLFSRNKMSEVKKKKEVERL